MSKGQTRKSQTAEKKKLTPLMTQFWEQKSAHTDKILLFRMGDFFEMFHDDALVAAPILNIALTQRNKKSGDSTPMCGVPHHSIGEKINMLLAAGHKVAICDQIEDPKQAKGLVKRAVTRVLSPGVVFDPETLDATTSNYLVSFNDTRISFLEASTGEAFFYDLEDRLELFTQVKKYIGLLNPTEVVVGSKYESICDKLLELFPKLVVSIHQAPAESLEDSNLVLIDYAKSLQGDEVVKTLAAFERRELVSNMQLKQTTISHLELFESNKGDRRESLFYYINRTRTAAGARKLKQWLCFPLFNKQEIEKRQNVVKGWVERSTELKPLRQTLAQMGDIQRRLGKISNPSCSPRDVQSLAQSIAIGLEVSKYCNISLDGPIGRVRDLHEQIQKTLVEEPPLAFGKGDIIRKGFCPKLDELIEWASDSQKKVAELEERERQITGIPSLKVRYNQVFGYYIEVTNAHKSKVPKERYLRKQTLTNAERYSTDELTELEKKVLSARSKREDLEKVYFDQLKSDVLNISSTLIELSHHWAELDVVTSLAWLAIENSYVCPEFIDEEIHLESSRHPVVEASLGNRFVANNIHIRRGECLLLTGPNMAGKSTLMRQVALIAIMAQIGSFVPAMSARLPLFDRIFTRIGASDSLAEGLSTFMVEMTETAELLEESTPQSLVVMDEVGRGTSTYDGMALAQSILEELVEKIKSTTLFATHYHELTSLDQNYNEIHNGHIAIDDSQNPIEFLHLLKPGPANRSYGVHVAELAGIPDRVTKRASLLLSDLESQASSRESLRSTTTNSVDSSSGGVAQIEADTQQLDFLGALESDPYVAEKNALIEEISRIEISKTTPLEALNRLDRLRSQVSKFCN